MTNGILNFLSKIVFSKRRFVDFQKTVAASKEVTICYAITVCNEHDELRSLLTVLGEYKNPLDTILVQVDTNKVTTQVKQVLADFASVVDRQVEFPFAGDFSCLKNNLLKHIDSDYVFQLDADEIPSPYLLKNIHSIVTTDTSIEAFRLPRINVLLDDEQEIIGWNELDSIPDTDFYHFPDYQFRIFKRLSTISWHKKVHEVITGFKSYTLLPKKKEYALLHPKHRSRQERQLQYYDQLKKAGK